jgi:hypothetical protein
VRNRARAAGSSARSACRRICWRIIRAATPGRSAAWKAADAAVAPVSDGCGQRRYTTDMDGTLTGVGRLRELAPSEQEAVRGSLLAADPVSAALWRAFSAWGATAASAAAFHRDEPPTARFRAWLAAGLAPGGSAAGAAGAVAAAALAGLPLQGGGRAYAYTRAEIGGVVVLPAAAAVGRAAAQAVLSALDGGVERWGSVQELLLVRWAGRNYGLARMAWYPAAAVEEDTSDVLVARERVRATAADLAAPRWVLGRNVRRFAKYTVPHVEVRNGRWQVPAFFARPEGSRLAEVTLIIPAERCEAVTAVGRA